MLWESRGETGVFKNEKFLQFHKCVVERFSKNSWVKIYLAIVNNRQVAALYGYQYGDVFYVYQSGFDPDWKGYGIGKILMYHYICESIKKKIKEFDFLRGEEFYKEDFTDKCRHSNDIFAYGDSWKNRAYRFLLELPDNAKERMRNHLILKYPFMVLKSLKNSIDWIKGNRK
jgi:CelD/BcsL family acetyltransferase involved in cellulose biosynthesis